MSVLDDIIEGASSGSVPVATLLLKVKVLAARLRSVQLEGWVESELTGYVVDGKIQPVPAYRGPFPAEVQGNFMLPFAKSSVVLGIASSGFDTELSTAGLFENTFAESIGSLEVIASKQEGVSIPWTNDVVSFVNSGMRIGKIHLYRDALLLSAWRVIGPGDIPAVIAAVRSRVLDFALSLEKLGPQIGERGVDIPASASTIINNYFQGGVASIAQADGAIAIGQVVVGDRDSLFAALRAGGLDEVGIREVQDALDLDAADSHDDGSVIPGPRILSWLERAGAKVLQGGSGVAIGAGGSILAEAVLRYFGLA